MALVVPRPAGRAGGGSRLARRSRAGEFRFGQLDGDREPEHCAFDDTSTLLTNGEVLVAGGSDDNTGLASAELYNPANGSWSLTGSMHAGREGQSATLLDNGQVLAGGGVNFVKHKFTQLASAELYTP